MKLITLEYLTMDDLKELPILKEWIKVDMDTIENPDGSDIGVNGVKFAYSTNQKEIREKHGDCGWYLSDIMINGISHNIYHKDGGQIEVWEDSKGLNICCYNQKPIDEWEWITQLIEINNQYELNTTEI